MCFVAFDPHGEAQPLAPSALRQFFHLFLPAEELAFTLLGVQEEALEVAEAIKDQAGYLARERSKLFTFRLFVTAMFPSAFPSRRRQNLRRVAAKRGNSAGYLSQIPMEHRVPTAVVRNRLGDPAQH